MGINNNGGYGGESRMGGSRYVPPHLRNSSGGGGGGGNNNNRSFGRSNESWGDAPRTNRSNDRYYIAIVIIFHTFSSSRLFWQYKLVWELFVLRMRSSDEAIFLFLSLFDPECPHSDG
jgi:hypothetical protein